MCYVDRVECVAVQYPLVSTSRLDADEYSNTRVSAFHLVARACNRVLAIAIVHKGIRSACVPDQPHLIPQLASCAGCTY